MCAANAFRQPTFQTVGGSAPARRRREIWLGGGATPTARAGVRDDCLGPWLAGGRRGATPLDGAAEGPGAVLLESVMG